MKIQNLAVIFIIIILPISLILTSYTQNQVKTLGLQVSYDNKLNNATYDALKAFQLNTFSSDTSDLSNSKIKDIEASANTFFTSIASNFNMEGYNKDVLKDYVPALVYTMYDGYYIYSPYTNTLSENETKDDSTYKNGEKIYGLKPYIYYSRRYKNASDYDVVITYTLDNCITIQGVVEGKAVYKSGYLLDNVDVEGQSVRYRGIEINTEITKEYIDKDKELVYKKIKGEKSYKENDNKWYTMRNGKKTYLMNTDNLTDTNDAGKQYYIKAKEFSDWIRTSKLKDLRVSDSVDEYGQRINIYDQTKIFDFLSETHNTISIEDPDSNFNQQRLEVIRNSIEKNLSIAIANYNNYTGVKTNFQMPKLKEDEWTKIINNISIISFLQGLNIGGKVYNGYSIINNTKNNEYVSEDSIYLADESDYYKINDTNITGTKDYIGVLNIDFERKTYTDENGVTKYFFPKKQLGSYSSIVNQSSIKEIANGNIYKYIDENDASNFFPRQAAKAYATALGRERYSMYRTNNIY